MKRRVLGVAIIIVLFSSWYILSFAFEDNISVIKSRIFNYVNKNKDPLCFGEVYLEDGRFKPNIEKEFDGCQTYLTPTRYSINGLGLRNKNVSVKKRESVLRILAIGDSVTFGHGLNDKDTFPYTLEMLLNERCNKDVEVINFGIPGFSAEDELRLFSTLGTNLTPDIVLLTFVGNDWENEPLAKKHDEYYENLAVKHCLNNCTNEEKLQLYFQAQHYMRIDNINLTFGVIDKTYRKINSIAKEKKIVVIGGYLPVESEWMSKLTILYGELGWETVNLTRFHQYPKYFINIADTHPNKKATQEIASEYAKKIISYCT